MNGKLLLIIIWIVNLAPAIAGILIAISTGHIFWISLMIISGLMLRKGFMEIPLKPPHIGVFTFWGRKINIVFGEMLLLMMDYFPFFLGITLVDVEKKNKDYEFPDIRCRLEDDEQEVENMAKKKVRKEKKAGDGTFTYEKALEIVKKELALKPAKSGGKVKINSSITYIPDKERPIPYINSGGREGVEQIIHDMIAEDSRQAGGKMTWEQMSFAKDRLSAIFITKLTNMPIYRIARNADGNVKKDADGKPIYEEDSNGRKKPIDLNAISDEDVSYDISHFLTEALSDGVADVHDLGIKVQRFNITDVEPQGELENDAELAARERQQRRKQEEEQRTRATGAKQMVKDARKAGDETFTYGQALEILRIEEGKTDEVVVRSSGNPVLDAAALFQQNKKGV